MKFYNYIKKIYKGADIGRFLILSMPATKRLWQVLKLLTTKMEIPLSHAVIFELVLFSMHSLSMICEYYIIEIVSTLILIALFDYQNTILHEKNQNYYSQPTCLIDLIE